MKNKLFIFILCVACMAPPQIYCISPPSSLQEDRALSLKERDALAIRNLILAKYHMAQYHMALDDLDWKVRQQGATNLNDLALVLADSGNLALLKTEWLPLYEKAIRDSSWGVSMYAANSLGGYALAVAQLSGNLEKEVLPLYKQIQEHPVWAIRSGAVKSLGTLSQAVLKKGDLKKWETLVLPLYEKALQDPLSSIIRQNTVKSFTTLVSALAEKGGFPAITNLFFPLFDQAVKDVDNNVRAAAFECLGELTHAAIKKGTLKNLQEEIIPLFQEELIHQDEAVRQKTVGHLGILGKELLLQGDLELFKNLWLPLYQQALKDPDENIQQHAAKNLNSLSEALIQKRNAKALLEQVLPLYHQALEEKWSLCLGAAESLGTLAQALARVYDFNLWNDHILLLYHKASQHPSLAVQKGVAKSLPSLLEAFATTSDFETWKEKIFPIYREGLSHPQEKRRQAIAEHLGILAKTILQHGSFETLNKHWLPLFESALQDPEKHVRYYAAASLAQLTQGASSDFETLQHFIFPLFEKMLAHRDPDIRCGAAESLGALANALKQNPNKEEELLSCISCYQEALQDPESSVRFKATSHLNALSSLLLKKPLLSAPLLTQEFLLRDNLRAEETTSLFLGMALLHEPYIQRPTEIWESILLLLIHYKKVGLPQHAILINTFSALLSQALSRQASPIDQQTIQTLYQQYFEDEEGPQKTKNPKQLIGLMLHDFTLSRWKLPKEYGKTLRALRHPPSYSQLLPLLTQLNSKDPFFREFILQAFHSRDPSSDTKKYWGEIQKILEIASRDHSAFHTLKLWDEVKTILTFPQSHAFLTIKEVQKKKATIEKLIPNKIGAIFHIPNHTQNPTFSEKEINVALYVARAPEFASEHHIVNQALKVYFKARLEGKTESQAAALFIESRQKEEGPFFPKIDSREGMLYLSHLDFIAQNRMTQWQDALRHFKELIETLPKNEERTALVKLLKEIPKNPSEKQFLEYSTKLKEELHQSSFLQTQKEVIQTIEQHLKQVELSLQPKQSQESAPLLSNMEPCVKASIEIADNPIERLHLGWPYLGNSCLDLTQTQGEERTGGYLLYPFIRVIYIRNTKNRAKPLARLSVAYDKTTNTLFLVSPIKSNSPYEYRPLIEPFLTAWAEHLGAKLILPSSLYPEPWDPFLFQLKENLDVALPEPLLPLYTDLTGQLKGAWAGKKIKGWVLAPLAPTAPGIDESL